MVKYKSSSLGDFNGVFVMNICRSFRKNFIRIFFLLLVVGGLGLAPGAVQAQGQGAGQRAIPDDLFPKGTVTVQTDDGRRIPFVAEIATTPRQRALGLMYRESLAADAAMLFVWEEAGDRAMWMKNTLVPLDMFFLDGEGRIIHIAHSTTPQSLEHIMAPEPTRGVLEVNAGTAKLLSIDPGDRVLHPLLGGDPVSGGAR